MNKYINEFKIQFELGQIVYLITDDEQKERIIDGINLRPGGSVSYSLALGGNSTWHYGIEICTTKDILKAIG